MPSWDEIRGLRREWRASLIARRKAMPQPERQRLQPVITGLLEFEMSDHEPPTTDHFFPARPQP